MFDRFRAWLEDRVFKLTFARAARGQLNCFSEYNKTGRVEHSISAAFHWPPVFVVPAHLMKIVVC